MQKFQWRSKSCSRIALQSSISSQRQTRVKSRDVAEGDYFVDIDGISWLKDVREEEILNLNRNISRGNSQQISQNNKVRFESFENRLQSLQQQGSKWNSVESLSSGSQEDSRTIYLLYSVSFSNLILIFPDTFRNAD